MLQKLKKCKHFTVPLLLNFSQKHCLNVLKAGNYILTFIFTMQEKNAKIG